MSDGFKQLLDAVQTARPDECIYDDDRRVVQTECGSCDCLRELHFTPGTNDTNFGGRFGDVGQLAWDFDKVWVVGCDCEYGAKIDYINLPHHPHNDKALRQDERQELRDELLNEARDELENGCEVHQSSSSYLHDIVDELYDLAQSEAGKK